MKVKEESEKVGLKLNIQRKKIMASSTMTSWQIDGETMETVTDFILGGSKITAESNCSYEIKRHLFLGRKAMTNLDSILKSRDIVLPTKVCLVKAMIFPVFMYGCESWTIKKAAAATAAKSLQLCPTLRDPMDCSPPGSSVYGILKARVLEWVVIAFSSSHAWMWELDYKEGWAPKNWCFWTVVLTLESPLDCQEIQPVHPKGNQSWIFIGRTDGWSWSSNSLAT